MRFLFPLARLGAVLLVLATLPTASAQLTVGDDALSATLSGGIQPRVGYDTQREPVDAERIGFGLRRARLQGRVTAGGQFGAEYDVELSPGSVQSVDVFAFANVADRVRVRAGQLAGAQPRGFVPTGYTVIDAVDRAAILKRWALGTIGPAGRDVGVDVRYLGEQTQLGLFVHNGSGGGLQAGDNVAPVASGALAEEDRLGLAVSAAVTHALTAVPGVELGAFAGVSSGSDRTRLGAVERSYATGSAHLYWGAQPGSQPVRLKADALVLRYEEVQGEQPLAAGVSGLAAVRVLSHGEVFARAEGYWRDTEADADVYGTAGLSYSLSAARGLPYQAARLTLAYTGREVLGVTGHLVVLQGQLAF